MKALCAAFVALFVSVILATATPVTIPNETATLDIPDTWSLKPTPAEATSSPLPILSALSPDTNTAVTVLVVENSEGITAQDAAFVGGVRKGITRTATAEGATVDFQPDATLTLGGVPASCVQYTEKTAAGKTVDCRVYDFAANGKMYAVSIQSLDPTQDSTMVGIANSLKFSSPPTLPAGASDLQIGRIGIIVVLVIGGCFVLAVVAAVAGLIWWAVKKKA